MNPYAAGPEYRARLHHFQHGCCWIASYRKRADGAWFTFRTSMPMGPFTDEPLAHRRDLLLDRPARWRGRRRVRPLLIHLLARLTRALTPSES